MKRIAATALVFACLNSTAWAAPKEVELKDTGHEKELAIVVVTKEFADNIKAQMVDPKRLLIGTADVNGDGKDEIFVNDTNSFSCGSMGCTTYVFQEQKGTYAPIMYVTTGDTLGLGDKSTNDNGYKDIYLLNPEGKAVRWVYDGKKYEHKGE